MFCIFRGTEEPKSRTEATWGLTNLLLLSCLFPSYLMITNLKLLLTSHDRNSCFTSVLWWLKGEILYVICLAHSAWNLEKISNKSKPDWRRVKKHEWSRHRHAPSWAAVFSMQLLTKALDPVLKSDSPLGPSAGKKGFQTFYTHLKAQQLFWCLKSLHEELYIPTTWISLSCIWYCTCFSGRINSISWSMFKVMCILIN